MHSEAAAIFWQVRPMSGKFFGAAAFVMAAVSVAAAEPVTLTGTIGNAPVVLTLDESEGKLEGWYLYLRIGKQIRLEGRRDGTTFAFDEFPEPGKPKTGSFAGAIAQGRWTGTWQKPAGGPPLAVALAEESAALSSASINLSCRTRKDELQFGYSYRYDLSLSLKKGAVAKFTMSQRATSKAGDDQGCEISLDDLKQVPSKSSILLRARDGGDNACTIRLVGVGDYVYAHVGDGNDCRGGEGVAYCSPRSFWSSMVINRKSNTCKPVE